MNRALARRAALARLAADLFDGLAIVTCVFALPLAVYLLGGAA